MKLEFLSSGAYAEVFRTKVDDKPAVIKVALGNSSCKLETEDVRGILREGLCLMHGYGPAYKGVAVEAGGGDAFGGLVMDACDTTLQRAAEALRVSLGAEAAVPRLLQWILAVCSSLARMHRNGLLHRDIKPNNILIKGSEAILCDFGLVCKSRTALAQAAEGGAAVMDRRVCTIWYRPPEHLGPVRLLEYGPEVDVWALGSTLWHCVTDCPVSLEDKRAAVYSDVMELCPWDDEARRDSIRRRLTEFGIAEGSAHSAPLTELLAMMMNPCARKRPSIADVSVFIVNHWAREAELAVSAIQQGRSSESRRSISESPLLILKPEQGVMAATNMSAFRSLFKTAGVRFTVVQHDAACLSASILRDADLVKRYTELQLITACISLCVLLWTEVDNVSTRVYGSYCGLDAAAFRELRLLVMTRALAVTGWAKTWLGSA